MFSISTGTMAQARKCVGPDGKVTYSDVVCNTTSKESALSMTENNLDHSGMRQQAGKQAAEADMAAARASPPPQCKFKYYVTGDSLGKTLAAQAKEECIQNAIAKRQGKEGTLEAYSRWKDHFAQTDSSRQNALNRANASENAQAIARSNRNAIEDVGNQVKNRTYTCKPSMMGDALNCK